MQRKYFSLALIHNQSILTACISNWMHQCSCFAGADNNRIKEVESYECRSLTHNSHSLACLCACWGLGLSVIGVISIKKTLNKELKCITKDVIMSRSRTFKTRGEPINPTRSCPTLMRYKKKTYLYCIPSCKTSIALVLCCCLLFRQLLSISRASSLTSKFASPRIPLSFLFMFATLH